MGQIAAKKSKTAAKPKKVKKVENAKKNEDAIEISNDGDGEPAVAQPKGREVAKEKKRRPWPTSRGETIEVFSSIFGVQEAQAVNIFEQARAKFSLGQMSQAARALLESNAGKFTEAEFMAKAAEVKAEDVPPPQGKTAAQKAAKIERKAAKKAKKARQAEAAANAKKKQAVVGKSAPDHHPEPMQGRQAGEDIPMDTAPVSSGFTTEFWMGLAGSREAAAVASAGA